MVVARAYHGAQERSSEGGERKDENLQDSSRRGHKPRGERHTPGRRHTAPQPPNRGGGGVDETDRREAAPEGFIQEELVDQDEDEEEDTKITEHARNLKRLDTYQSEIQRLQQQRDQMLKQAVARSRAEQTQNAIRQAEWKGRGCSGKYNSSKRQTAKMPISFMKTSSCPR